jgi:hypothetical protein
VTQAPHYFHHIHKQSKEAEKLPMAIESTKPAAAEAPKPPAHATQDLASSIWKEAEDFGEGVFHGAVEAPVNGVVQLANHITNSNLPELHLVNEKDVDGTIAGKIGSFVGTTADMIGLTLATGGLGGAGAVATGLRLAAVGALYSGVLTPSADNTKNFFADRATSAAVGALTFGAMGAAASGLDALGTFAAPAIRSLAGSIGYGAIIGAAGGAVNSEATATLKEGKLLPSASEFFGDVASFTAFGAAFGAASYGLQRIENPIQNFKINDKQLKVYNDSEGNPFRLEGTQSTQSKNYPLDTFKWTADKGPDGHWSSYGEERLNDTYFAPPAVDSVVKDPDGSINLIGENQTTHYGTDGLYQQRDLARERAATQWNVDLDDEKRTLSTIMNEDPKESEVGRTLDQHDRLTKIYDGNGGNPTLADIYYDKSGDVSKFTVNADKQRINFTQSGNGSYDVYNGDSVYKFNGTIKPIGSLSSDAATVQFTSTDGKTFNYDAATAQSFMQTAKANMQQTK